MRENRLSSWLFVESRGESAFFALTRGTLRSVVRKGSPLRSDR